MEKTLPIILRCPFQSKENTSPRRSLLVLHVMEQSFMIEQTYYCLYVRLHLLYLCVAAE
jgi:hypothetical protein